MYRPALLILAAVLGAQAAAVPNVVCRDDKMDMSKTIRTTYGPFLAPVNETTMGMIDYTMYNVTKPCSNCFVTKIHAGLTYEDGTEANANTSMWLHHTAWVNVGYADMTCPSQGYDRFFASGNERTPLDLTLNGTVNAGYPFGPNDYLVFVVELMNMATYNQSVVLTMDWEYVPKSDMTTDYLNAKALWLDIGGFCNSTSEVDVPMGEDVFSITSPTFTMNATGNVIRAGGHLHDGGVDLEIKKNGVIVCDAVASYGAAGYDNPSGDDGMGDMGGMGGMKKEKRDDMGMSNLSGMTGCSDLGETVAGDQWSITANYNGTMYPLMMDGMGMPMPIMGISQVWMTYPQGSKIS